MNCHKISKHHRTKALKNTLQVLRVAWRRDRMHRKKDQVRMCSRNHRSFRPSFLTNRTRYSIYCVFSGYYNSMCECNLLYNTFQYPLRIKMEDV
ncbi:unnamed protein product [Acanthoscelides obtectus]|uniref:Uncharacterized protein n=1 Tax=Acanthoscelides obtectus TaxID=200917 RepID=A0A9P0LEM9_ACAOB|nr:unnamed protein product [Acanthoscelides obtectus]CAK1675195.1 hypothetical protein AOBTE_LOCUS30050 [Acanthoscelides obtectus]